MISEIKFRAWLDDGYNKWMEYDFYIHSSSGVLYDEATTTYDTSNKEIEKADNLTVMQYTGRKDINKVEIYEGDIIEATPFRPSDFDPWKGFVEFDPDRLRYIAGGDDVGAYESGELEVIGNIYENPELLEEIYG